MAGGALDARTHGPGADSGVDVESADFVVQVKARVSAAGRPDLQRLHGAAVGKETQAVFFLLGGFTPQAVQWANDVGLALFEFDLQGEPRGITDYALAFATDPEEKRLVEGWAQAGVFGNYVVVDHETGRVEGYRTWVEAYAATCEWDGGTLAPSVTKSFRSQSS